jgi:hypothetical protein
MPIPIPLDHVIDRVRADGKDTERRTLETLTGVSLSGQEARAAWPKILEHKWYMSECMGRDVGLRVAAVDFFEHVQPLPRSGAATMRAPMRARSIGRALLADPVQWLERVLSDFTRTLGGLGTLLLG